jgi:hypothetical protein
LRQKPSRPKTIHSVCSKDRDEDLLGLLHQSPGNFGKPTSLWTLDLAAQVCFEKGWTARLLCGESIRLVLKRPGIAWKRAKRWPLTPDPQEVPKHYGVSTPQGQASSPLIR